MKCPFKDICSRFDWKSPLCATGVGKNIKVVSAKICFDKHEFKNKAIFGHCYVCSKTTIYWMESVAQQERMERKLFTSQHRKKTSSHKCCSLVWRHDFSHWLSSVAPKLNDSKIHQPATWPGIVPVLHWWFSCCLFLGKTVKQQAEWAQWDPKPFEVSGRLFSDCCGQHLWPQTGNT